MNEKIKGGYLIRPRKIYDSWLMDKPPLWWKLWDWMLSEANFKDHNGVKRGQLFTTTEKMIEAMSWRVGARVERLTRDQLRRPLEGFTKAHMVTHTKTTRGIIITICKYDYFQDIKNYEDTHEDTHEDTTKTQTTPNDKGKKVKRKEVKPIEEKLSFGSHVKLTQKQFDSLVESLNGCQQYYIDTVNDYCAAHNKKYKDYAAAIRNFYRRDIEKKEQTRKRTCPPASGGYV